MFVSEVLILSMIDHRCTYVFGLEPGHLIVESQVDAVVVADNKPDDYVRLLVHGRGWKVR
jgi:hypothetical protein